MKMLFTIFLGLGLTSSFTFAAETSVTDRDAKALYLDLLERQTRDNQITIESGMGAEHIYTTEMKCRYDVDTSRPHASAAPSRFSCQISCAFEKDSRGVAQCKGKTGLKKSDRPVGKPAKAVK